MPTELLPSEVVGSEAVSMPFEWPTELPATCPVCFEADTILDREGKLEFSGFPYFKWRECAGCGTRIVPMTSLADLCSNRLTADCMDLFRGAEVTVP